MDIEHHLLTITEKQDSIIEAKKSISFLYEEFKEFVYNITFQHIGFILNREELSNTVTSEVFLKIWEDPLDWEFDELTHRTQKDGFKAYLSTIAYYKLMEELKKVKSIREQENTMIDDEDSEWKWAVKNDEFDYLDEELVKRRNLVDECLYEFSEKKRDIARMYFLLYDENRRMSRENIILMETTFQTTWQNIRQIIFRMKKRIEVLLKDKIKSQ